MASFFVPLASTIRKGSIQLKSISDAFRWYKALLYKHKTINKKAKVKICKDFLKIIQSIKNDTTLTTRWSILYWFIFYVNKFIKLENNKKEYVQQFVLTKTFIINSFAGFVYFLNISMLLYVSVVNADQNMRITHTLVFELGLVKCYRCEVTWTF